MLEMLGKIITHDRQLFAADSRHRLLWQCGNGFARRLHVPLQLHERKIQRAKRN